MATNNSLKQVVSNTTLSKAPTTNELGVKGLLQTPSIQAKLKDMMKDKATAFATSVLSLVNNDAFLAKSEPMSIVAGAMTAATLDLPVDKNLGYAYLVPFYNKEGIQKAQFILGYKGYIQLAQRSGQYKALNVTPIYEGELISWNRLTEEIEFDPTQKVSDVVIGYCGHFELLNGFKKTVYWTKQEIESHRIKFNKSKNKKELTGVWQSDYDAMACKTVLRNLLGKWGILSIEMQTATTSDNKAMTFDDNTHEVKVAEPVVDVPETVTTTDAKLIDGETGEVIG